MVIAVVGGPGREEEQTPTEIWEDCGVRLTPSEVRKVKDWLSTPDVTRKYFVAFPFRFIYFF